MAWIDLSAAFAYGTKLTSTQMQNLRDNLTALANGDSGSPKIQTAAIDALQVSYPKLKIGTQEQSQSLAPAATRLFTLTGGAFCFLPDFKSTAGTATWEARYFSGDPGTSYAGPYCFVKNTHGVITDTIFCRHTYVTSSGEVMWLFILVDKVTDEILGMSFAPDHPCFGHDVGPEKIPHPFLNYDPSKHRILLANPDKELVERVIEANPDCILDGFRELCEISDGGKWPDKDVSIMHQMKMKIPKLNYVKMIELKWIG